MQQDTSHAFTLKSNIKQTPVQAISLAQQRNFLQPSRRALNDYQLAVHSNAITLKASPELNLQIIFNKKYKLHKSTLIVFNVMLRNE